MTDREGSEMLSDKAFTQKRLEELRENCLSSPSSCVLPGQSGCPGALSRME